MKKSLIALAVAAGTIAAAQADTTTLYGSLGYSISVAESNTDSNVKDAVKDNIWDLQTTTAKIGVKGTEDLSNGLQAFFKFEFGADNSAGLNSTRYAYLGLKGDFGTVTIGKQDIVWKLATNYNDIFNDSFFTGHYEGVKSGRVAKAISYVSPSMGGVNLAASIIIDGDLDWSDGIDAYELGALYNNNGLFAGASYHHHTDDGNGGTYELMGGSVGYSNDTFKVGFGAEHEASGDEYYNLAGEYYFGQNTLRAGIGINTDDDETKEYALGYQYNLSARTYTWVEGSVLDSKDNTIDGDYKVLVGIRHDF